MQKIHKRFKQFSFNRTDHILLQRVERQQERMATKGYESQPHLNKPAMNAKSKQIYESMIAKQKIEKKDGMSHQDYLISRGRQYE